MNLLAYILGKKYTDAHNTSVTAHDDVRTKIGTDIGTHNSAAGAHGGNIGKIYDTNSETFKPFWFGPESSVPDPKEENMLYLVYADPPV